MMFFKQMYLNGHQKKESWSLETANVVAQGSYIWCGGDVEPRLNVSVSGKTEKIRENPTKKKVHLAVAYLYWRQQS